MNKFNFGKAVKKAKRKNELRRGTVRYDTKSGKFFAELSDGTLLTLVQSYSDAKSFYSLPSNDVWEDWHKTGSGRTGVIAPKTLKVIMRSWATVKHRMIIHGNIVDKTFIIKYPQQ